MEHVVGRMAAESTKRFVAIILLTVSQQRTATYMYMYMYVPKQVYHVAAMQVGSLVSRLHVGIRTSCNSVSPVPKWIMLVIPRKL